MKVINVESKRALMSLINEADFDEFEDELEETYSEPDSFVKGSVIKVMIPIRVTPRPDGHFDGGEDSPGARRAARPRGTTSTIITPGTWCEVLTSGRNDAWVKPVDENGETLVDTRSGLEINAVKVNINKFNSSKHGEYKAGRGLPPSLGVTRPSVTTGATPQPARNVSQQIKKGGNPYEELQLAKAGFLEAQKRLEVAKAEFLKFKAAMEAESVEDESDDDELFGQ